MTVAGRLSWVMLFAALSLIGFDPPRGIAGWGATAEAGSAVVGGRKMSCQFGDVIFDNKLRGIGMASGSARKIWLNKAALSRYPRDFQQFVFLHECAHMYTRSETEADCWAIKRGVYRGLFTKRSLENICGAMWNTVGGAWHPPGPARCKLMARCFADATGQPGEATISANALASGPLKSRKPKRRRKQ